MISLGRSSATSPVLHVLDMKTSKSLCGTPAAKEILEVKALSDVHERDGNLCQRCQSIAETGNRAEPMHLRHKKSQLVELKDQLLTGEITYKAFQKAAYPLQKEIQAMEAKAV
jgi:hypothetical protein